MNRTGLQYGKRLFAFALAASGNFPVLLLSILWSGCTTRGVFWGGMLGVVVALVLTVLSPVVWETSLGFADAPFPYTSPTIFSMPLAFFTIWIVSKLDRSGRAGLHLARFPGNE